MLRIAVGRGRTGHLRAADDERRARAARRVTGSIPSEHIAVRRMLRRVAPRARRSSASITRIRRRRPCRQRSDVARSALSATGCHVIVDLGPAARVSRLFEIAQGRSRDPIRWHAPGTSGPASIIRLSPGCRLRPLACRAASAPSIVGATADAAEASRRRAVHPGLRTRTMRWTTCRGFDDATGGEIGRARAVG